MLRATYAYHGVFPVRSTAISPVIPNTDLCIILIIPSPRATNKSQNESINFPPIAAPIPAYETLGITVLIKNITNSTTNINFTLKLLLLKIFISFSLII